MDKLWIAIALAGATTMNALGASAAQATPCDSTTLQVLRRLNRKAAASLKRGKHRTARRPTLVATWMTDRGQCPASSAAAEAWILRGVVAWLGKRYPKAHKAWRRALSIRGSATLPEVPLNADLRRAFTVVRQRESNPVERPPDLSRPRARRRGETLPLEASTMPKDPSGYGLGSDPAWAAFRQAQRTRRIGIGLTIVGSAIVVSSFPLVALGTKGLLAMGGVGTVGALVAGIGAYLWMRGQRRQVESSILIFKGSREKASQLRLQIGVGSLALKGAF